MAPKPLLNLLNLPPALRLTTPTIVCRRCRRALHRLNAPTPRTPQPIPFVPDVPTFLTLIGRGLSSHAAKIASWEALFSASGQQLKESGIEPARARRYLLWWRERFRNGITGIGADMQHVKDGVGELRIVEIPSNRRGDAMATLSKDPGMRKVVVNVPYSLPDPKAAPSALDDEDGKVSTVTEPLRHIDSAESVRAISGIKIVRGAGIGGRGVEPVKGYQGVARLRVQEGLWEQKRGHKVDGGERRKAMVRAKRRVAERKLAR